MRELKFRAKRFDTIDWAYGFLYGIRLSSGNMQYLINDESGLNEREVIQSTIGQFTGLKDKNCKDIYEGDLVEVIHTEGISWEKNYISNGVVEYGQNGSFVVKCLKKGCENAKDISKRYFYLSFNTKREVTILGNIHEKETV